MTVHESCAWIAAHRSARNLAKRIGELVDRTSAPGDLLDVKRQALAHVRHLGWHVPPAGIGELSAVLLDALGAFEAQVDHRQVDVVLGAITEPVFVAVEIDLLREGIRQAFRSLLDFARIGDRLHVTYTRPREREDQLEVRLVTDQRPPDKPVDHELQSLRAWVEARGGTLSVVPLPEGLAVRITLPACFRVDEASE